MKITLLFPIMIATLSAPMSCRRMVDLSVKACPVELDLSQANDAERILYETVNGADLIVLHTGGSYGIADGVPENRRILEVTGPGDIASFLNRIKVHDSDGTSVRCECGGNPAISIFGNRKLLASISCHHFSRLRWSGWTESDMTLTCESAAFIRELCLDNFPRLIQLLRNDVEIAGAYSLIVGMGRQALPGIIEAVRTGDDNLRIALLRVYSYEDIQDRAAIPILLELMETDGNPEVRISAFNAYRSCLGGGEDSSSLLWRVISRFREKDFQGFIDAFASLPGDAMMLPFAEHLHALSLFETGRIEEAYRQIESMGRRPMFRMNSLFLQARLLLKQDRNDEAHEALSECKAMLDMNDEMRNLLLAVNLETGLMKKAKDIDRFIEGRLQGR